MTCPRAFLFSFLLRPRCVFDRHYGRPGQQIGVRSGGGGMDGERMKERVKEGESVC